MSENAQPTLTFNCIGSLPCILFEDTGVHNGGLHSAMNTANLGADQSVDPTTISAVSEQITTANSSWILIGNNNDIGIQYDGNANEVKAVVNGFTSYTMTVSDNSFHAFEQILNGASSATYVDNVSTTGSLNAGSVFQSGTNFNMGIGDSKETEAGMWQSAITPTQAANMNSNQHSYWGF